MDAPTVAALTTVAGAAILITVILQVLFRTLTLDPAVQDRFGPVIAIVIGIIVVELATATVISGSGDGDFFQGLINGIFAGLSAVGFHGFVNQTVIGTPKNVTPKS